MYAENVGTFHNNSINIIACVVTKLCIAQYHPHVHMHIGRMQMHMYMYYKQ